jgi:hypothetical protein
MALVSKSRFQISKLEEQNHIGANGKTIIVGGTILMLNKAKSKPQDNYCYFGANGKTTIAILEQPL